MCLGIITEALHEHTALLIFNISFNTAISITATLGNILILATTWKTSSLHSPSNTLLFNLALSDFCVGCIAEPLFLTRQFLVLLNNDHQRSCALADASFFINGVLGGVTFLTITSISIDRYLAVLLHLRYKEMVTDTTIRLVLIAIWILSGLIATSSVVKLKIFQRLWVTTGIICISAAFYAWSKVFQTVRRHQIQIQEQVQTHRQRFDMTKFRKSAINSLFVVLIFFLCYFPQLIALLMSSINPNSSLSYILVAYTLVKLNSSLNPLVYCWRQTDIRCAAKEMLARACFLNKKKHQVMSFSVGGEQSPNLVSRN